MYVGKGKQVMMNKFKVGDLVKVKDWMGRQPIGLIQWVLSPPSFSLSKTAIGVLIEGEVHHYNGDDEIQWLEKIQ